jgi:hypothetical protein
MTVAGSAYSLAKAALITVLEGAEDLAGVALSYQEPVDVEDVRAADGSWEAVFLAGAAGSFELVVLCAGQLHFDEDYTQELVIQVLRPSSLGTQRMADERAQEILFAVMAEISRQNEWDLDALGLGDFDHFAILPTSQRWETGVLDPSKGHGARLVLGLRVMARRGFTD